MKTLAAVLFAGGESRRMGRDKATLLLDGEPLWSRQLRTLYELRPNKVLVSARTRPAWCPPEIETVLDEPPSRGPLSGLVMSLNAAPTTHLLALAIDLPQMASVHLTHLWSFASPEAGVVPKNEQRLEPLCAIYPVTAAAVAAKALAVGRFSLQPLLENLLAQNRMRIYPLSVVERGLYRNANRPPDLA